MTDPVNVRIARFIGWTDVRDIGPRKHAGPWSGTGQCWVGKPPVPDTGEVVHGGCEVGLSHEYSYVPDFENDWREAGPLITRFRISIGHALIGDRWRSSAEILGVQGLFSLRWSDQGEADILPAVCRVLLALAEREQEKR